MDSLKRITAATSIANNYQCQTKAHFINWCKNINAQYAIASLPKTTPVLNVIALYESAKKSLHIPKFNPAEQKTAERHAQAFSSFMQLQTKNVLLKTIIASVEQLATTLLKRKEETSKKTKQGAIMVTTNQYLLPELPNLGIMYYFLVHALFKDGLDSHHVRAVFDHILDMAVVRKRSDEFQQPWVYFAQGICFMSGKTNVIQFQDQYPSLKNGHWTNFPFQSINLLWLETGNYDLPVQIIAATLFHIFESRWRELHTKTTGPFKFNDCRKITCIQAKLLLNTPFWRLYQRQIWDQKKRKKKIRFQNEFLLSVKKPAHGMFAVGRDVIEQFTNPKVTGAHASKDFLSIYNASLMAIVLKSTKTWSQENMLKSFFSSPFVSIVQKNVTEETNVHLRASKAVLALQTFLTSFKSEEKIQRWVQSYRLERPLSMEKHIKAFYNIAPHGKKMLAISLLHKTDRMASRQFLACIHVHNLVYDSKHFFLAKKIHASDRPKKTKLLLRSERQHQDGNNHLQKGDYIIIQNRSIHYIMSVDPIVIYPSPKFDVPIGTSVTKKTLDATPRISIALVPQLPDEIMLYILYLAFAKTPSYLLPLKTVLKTSKKRKLLEIQ